MKREEILFYLSEGKVRIYLYKSKKEYSYDIDTSLFFKWGEILNVELCSDAITKILAKINFGPYYLKPNLYVLYNDICHCDLKFLYRFALEEFNYNEIRFMPMSKLVELIKNDSNIVVYDKNYYTNIKRGEKTVNPKAIGKDVVIIGKSTSKHVHYSDDDIIWREFKDCFTNQKSYGIMNIGDDEC